MLKFATTHADPRCPHVNPRELLLLAPAPSCAACAEALESSRRADRFAADALQVVILVVALLTLGAYVWGAQ